MSSYSVSAYAGDVLKKLVTILKPIYYWILNALHSYWTWITSGSVSDVILKVATVTLLALGVAWFSGHIARIVQYIIYAACVVTIMLGIVAVLAKVGILHMALS